MQKNTQYHQDTPKFLYTHATDPKCYFSDVIYVERNKDFQKYTQFIKKLKKIMH